MRSHFWHKGNGRGSPNLHGLGKSAPGVAQTLAIVVGRKEATDGGLLTPLLSFSTYSPRLRRGRESRARCSAGTSQAAGRWTGHTGASNLLGANSTPTESWRATLDEFRR